MVYLLFFIFIICLAVLIYLLYDMNIFNKSYRSDSYVDEVSAQSVDQKILIELVKYEKFLYKKGFVRRNILKVGVTKSRVNNYKFYYYDIMQGVHAFLEVYKIGDKFAVNYFFITLYESKNYTLSTRFVRGLSSKNRDGIYIHKHSDLTIQELYFMHMIDRQKDNEKILKKRLTLKTLLNLPIFIKSVRLKREDRVADRVKSIKKVSIRSKIPSLKLSGI